MTQLPEGEFRGWSPANPEIHVSIDDAAVKHPYDGVTSEELRQLANQLYDSGDFPSWQLVNQELTRRRQQD